MFVKAQENVERFHTFINEEFDDIALLDFHRFVTFVEWTQEFRLTLPPNVFELCYHISKWESMCRLVRKYMPQPGLMKMRRTFIDKTCLSSDLASIAFACFLNSTYASLKCAIQFMLIQTAQNPLQALKKLVLISQLNPFEFFFDGRKYVQVISDQIRWTELVWHAVNAMFFEPICWTPTCVNRAIVDRNHQSFSMRCPSAMKNHLF
jgi:hypothetical protein